MQERRGQRRARGADADDAQESRPMVDLENVGDPGTDNHV